MIASGTDAVNWQKLIDIVVSAVWTRGYWWVPKTEIRSAAGLCLARAKATFRPSSDPGNNFRAYLVYWGTWRLRTMLNHWADRRRRLHREKLESQTGPPDWPEAERPEFAVWDRDTMLPEWFHALPQRTREIISLRVAGYSYRAAGERLGISGSRVAQILKKLGRDLQKQGVGGMTSPSERSR